jgi:hypothetical protein
MGGSGGTWGGEERIGELKGTPLNLLSILLLQGGGVFIQGVRGKACPFPKERGGGQGRENPTLGHPRLGQH